MSADERPPPAPREDEIPAVGALFADRYQIRARVGRGSVGTVLRAFDTVELQEVAVRLLPPGSLTTDADRARFAETAQAMCALRHPNVVEVQGFRVSPTRAHIVMEYLQGRSLAEFMSVRRPRYLTADEVVSVFDQACRGVEAIHRAGRVHGDLTPRNVIIGPAFRVVICELGLPRTPASESDGADVEGTPGYMAPEAILGSPASPEFDNRRDIYALGVILFEMLTGRPPFEASDLIEIMRQHVEQPPPRVSELRPELTSTYDELVLECLRKDPRQRPPTANGLRQMLFDARRQQAIVDRRPLRFVVVDDDPDFRRWLGVVLGEAYPNAHLQVFGSADEALREIDRPSLIITDLEMPDMGGAALTERLRTEPATSEVPVIVLTGVGGASDWRALRAIGADAFQLKPVDLDALLASIRRLVGGTSQPSPKPEPA